MGNKKIKTIPSIDYEEWKKKTEPKKKKKNWVRTKSRYGKNVLNQK